MSKPKLTAAEIYASFEIEKRQAEIWALRCQGEGAPGGSEPLFWPLLMVLVDDSAVNIDDLLSMEPGRIVRVKHGPRLEFPEGIGWIPPRVIEALQWGEIQRIRP